MGPRMSGGRSRRRRRGGRRVLGVIVLLAIVGVVVWQWPSIVGSGPDDANAANQGEATKTDGPGTNRLGTPDLVVNRENRSPLTPARVDRGDTQPSPGRVPNTDFTMGGEPNANDGGSGRPSSQPETTPNDPVRQPETNAGFGVSAAVGEAVQQAEAHVAANRHVEARDVLNRALFRKDLNATDADLLRSRLSDLSETLTFSPRAYPDDTMADSYTVRSGDALSVIPRRAGLLVDYRLIQRINNISDPSKIRLNQKLKVLQGPFHAVVDKSAFRMDLYADQTDSAGNLLYIRSFPVGLGEYGTTPVGSWIVREAGKVVNPAWVNPRTGEKFDKNDPDIPIGERWIALKGTDSETELLGGYGIHGTNEPESIGMEMSMGCIRMLGSDVELVYEVLYEGVSTVQIVD